MPKILDEKISVGGGATGKSEVPEPVGGTATLPNSKKQGDPMQKIDAKGTAAVTTTDDENNVETVGNNAEKNKSSISSKVGVLTTKAEDIEAIFSGEEISEEFKAKAAIVYEAAVEARVEQEVQAIAEQMQEEAEKLVAETIEEMATELNEALDFAIQKWLEENEVAIVSSLRANIAEEFIGKLKEVFEESYIDVPEDKVDVVEELSSQVEKLEQDLNNATKQAIDLQSSLNEYARKEVIADVSEGLTVTQAEKLASLAEGIEFDSIEGFKKKLDIVKDSYFSNNGKTKSTVPTSLEEQTTDEDANKRPEPTGTVARYVQAITRGTPSL